ncbi:MAG: FeoA family protein [Microcoleaceae cyanobacterium]
MNTLADLPCNKLAIIEKILIDQHTEAYGEGFAHRLAAMGIVPNQKIQVLRQALFGGPLHVRVGATTELAIRLQEAKMILVGCVNEV